MARGSAQATTAANTAQKQAGTDYGNANALFGPLSAELQTQAIHPSGINPTDLARSDTAALETGGGSTAAAVGQGALRAARTRNSGGSDAATGSSVRSGGETASRGILANRMKNAEVKAGQQEHAESGLNSLFAENLSGGNQALGIVPNAVNADVQAKNASWNWAKDLFGPLMGAAGSAAGGYLSR
jgi:hypothetical protein